MGLAPFEGCLQNHCSLPRVPGRDSDLLADEQDMIFGQCLDRAFIIVVLASMWLWRDREAATLCSRPCCPDTATPRYNFLTAEVSFSQELRLLERKKMVVVVVGNVPEPRAGMCSRSLQWRAVVTPGHRAHHPSLWSPGQTREALPAPPALPWQNAPVKPGLQLHTALSATTWQSPWCWHGFGRQASGLFLRRRATPRLRLCGLPSSPAAKGR